MVSNNEANAVMARVVRMPFYHHFVTIELTRRSQEQEGEVDPNSPQTLYSKVEETGILFICNLLFIYGFCA